MSITSLPIDNRLEWEGMQKRFKKRLPVLMYHHVGPVPQGPCLCDTISPERFERHVDWLARRGFVGIRPSDWVRWCREGKSLPDKPVLLTFDDGYADTAEYGLTVLRRYNFGAAVFIVTGLMGSTNAWDAEHGSLSLRLMTAEQIRFWAARGIEFGAHSRTHVDLATLDAKSLTEEVVGSKRDLADLLGASILSFAYPYGSCNQAVYRAVRRDFDIAFLADGETTRTIHSLIDLHLLQRTAPRQGDTWADLECFLRWGHNPMRTLRARMGLRSGVKRAANTFLARLR
jgi:peptidoglycan/xylan/chitin deacetylase (PgdA/CDA1 family)